jgi:predicted ATPase/class 3 adenylate cyclase
MPDLPSGTVTFLFTDIEGSTALWEQDRAAMAAAVERHLTLLRTAVSEHQGTVFKVVGDAAQAAFASAPAAVSAGLDAQRTLQAEQWPAEVGPLRVRMALHTGVAEPVAGDYLAPALNRLSRTLAAGHGGQILVTEATRHLVVDHLPPGVTLRSLGRHALRDLEVPEVVFQVVAPGLPDRFPDLRSLPHHPTNLVVPPSALVGRDAEQAMVSRMVRDEDARLVTLTGPGGSGKTRLGQEIAADLLDAFPDGVFFVDLAGLRDPTLVLAAIASILGVREAGAVALHDTLAAYLTPKCMLLVLDNCEQVIEAASDIAVLLTTCPHLSILATSREPLHLRWEKEYPVSPLALPEGEQADLAELARVPAVALFVARASASNPHFALTEANVAAVVEICRRLDGLPLAIELAAARVRLLPPTALLDRLERRLPLLAGGSRDLPNRQQTMRDTIAWSYDLLSPEEQTPFQFLSVFPSGFTLEAAESVVDDDLLASLVAKSLVVYDGDADDAPRYRMLETIREFGQERLAASGQETAARRRHAAWALALAERAGPMTKGPDAAVWVEVLEREHASLQTALTWFRDQSDGPRLMRMAVALLVFWQDRGYYREGRQWLAAALALGQDAPARGRMRAMSGAGTMAWYQTDVPQASHWHEQALALAREVGDREVEALSLSNLGAQATELGDLDRAVANYEASLAVGRAADEPEAMVLALHNLAHVTLLRGEPAAAADRFAEALRLAREHHVSWIVPTILVAFGSAMVDLGDDERAAALLREGLDLGRARGNTADVIEALEGLARVNAVRGQIRDGTRLYGAAATLRDEIAMPQSPTEIASTEPILNRLREALGPEDFAAAWVAGQALPQQDAITLAQAIPVASPRSAART